MRSKKRFGVTNIGTVSLLMIFIVLCMVIFAVLTLSASLSDYRYNQELAQHTTEYYEASNTAEEKLAALEAKPGETVSFEVPMNETQALAVEVKILNDGSYQIQKWEKVNTDTWEGENRIQLIR